jgi:hypothetical protein
MCLRSVSIQPCHSTTANLYLHAWRQLINNLRRRLPALLHLQVGHGGECNCRAGRVGGMHGLLSRIQAHVNMPAALLLSLAC